MGCRSHGDRSAFARWWMCLFVASSLGFLGKADSDLPNQTVEVLLRKVFGRVVEESDLPLRTKERYIVDRHGLRVKWSCVNWHGAQSPAGTMGGMRARHVQDIAALIAKLGFNCVRIAYSTDGVIRNPVISKSAVKANPELYGAHYLDCLDAVVSALAQNRLMIIMNNHLSRPGWCCNIDQPEGLWYVDGYPEESWIQSLSIVAERYRGVKWVVAHDVRNEPHNYAGTRMTWGSGDPKTDWAAAAERGGRAVRDKDPEALIVVEGLCFAMELRPVRDRQIQLSNVVYEVHNYVEFQFWTLLNTQFFSWGAVWVLCFAASSVLISIMFGLIYTCIRLKWPWPPKGVFLVTLGSWLLGISLPLIAIASAAYVFYLRYCDYVSQQDARPWLLKAIASSLLGIGCLAAGHCRARGCKAKHTVEVITCKALYRRQPEQHDSESTSSNGDTEDELEPDQEVCCLSALARAHSPADGGPCCFRSWHSCRVAADRTVGPEWQRKGSTRPVWDCGLCCMLQSFLGTFLLQLVVLYIWSFAQRATTYDMLAQHLDSTWGFMLRPGYKYTAPVWMGEFGAAAPGGYWLNFIRYLSEHDVDWAYWPLNGDKYADGYFTQFGEWKEFTEPKWENDTFGLLEADYSTIREPWRVLDLQALMDSPSSWVPHIEPCDRAVLGAACGG